MQPNVKAFFDPATWTLTYVVWDAESKDAVLIDPVLDFDPLAIETSEDSVQEVAKFINDNGLHLRFTLETHAHADHLSGARAVKAAFPYAESGIGAHITTVQEVFSGLFNRQLPTAPGDFDVKLADGEVLEAGALKVEVLHTPGHTPACVTYKIGDSVFTGDALFMPDFGTGRCDFPGGSATDLYNSIANKLYALPDDTRVFVGHDYQPGGRPLKYETTIAESKASNVHLKGDTSEEDFVAWRTARDKTLRMPKLIFQSVQVNADGGRLPNAEDNGIGYLKIPMNLSKVGASA